ncbi:hypothetical protein L1887_19403 [Cichorium endivia]|nr:hypothetical protein L1887_19403 [Cichorium endivia]
MSVGHLTPVASKLLLLFMFKFVVCACGKRLLGLDSDDRCRHYCRQSPPPWSEIVVLNKVYGLWLPRSVSQSLTRKQPSTVELNWVFAFH